MAYNVVLTDQEIMENQTIEKIDFRVAPLEAEYSQCTFVGCDFSQMTLADLYVESCTFVGCNFSLTKFCNVLRDAQFKECKMTGADFSSVSKFALSMRFEKCLLSYASFVEVKIKSTTFANCDLSEAYFDNANVESSVFDNCDLNRTSFARTNLRKVDFSTAYNFSIDPTSCDLKEAIFSQADLRGLLTNFGIKILDV